MYAIPPKASTFASGVVFVPQRTAPKRSFAPVPNAQARDRVDQHALDETDAALDESNVGRFREALAFLTEQTQFILITHNRGTIEAADTLYGVTMGDDGASKTISLRVEEYVADGV